MVRLITADLGRARYSQVQSVTNIFEYSNILGTNIYSDIRTYQFVFYEYIRTFVHINFLYEYIRTFVGECVRV